MVTGTVEIGVVKGKFAAWPGAAKLARIARRRIGVVFIDDFNFILFGLRWLIGVIKN
jgi:hypothetical protein